MLLAYHRAVPEGAVGDAAVELEAHAALVKGGPGRGIEVVGSGKLEKGVPQELVALKVNRVGTTAVRNGLKHLDRRRRLVPRQPLWPQPLPQLVCHQQTLHQHATPSALTP